MAGLMDILLALVNALCGSSTTRERPPVEYQKSEAERPYQQATTTPRRPQRAAPEHRRRPSVGLNDASEQEPKPVYQPEHKPPTQDQNQINQHDAHYTGLRAKANENGDLMARCFQESHEAYSRGDGARAKELSEQGKQHERTMESLNAQASAWIFRQNNLDSKPGEIDLHGLYVKEAVSYADKSIQEARQRGDTEIRLIVGKGLHSDGHVAKIKPAIEDFMRKHGIPAEVNPHNGGVLLARLI